MKHLAVLFFFAAIGLASADDRPNIVLMMVDDLGFADFGCYGSEIETPHIDAMAKDGIQFTQFYNTAKCHSSRVSLLTGLYCNQAGSNKLDRGSRLLRFLEKLATARRWSESGI